MGPGLVEIPVADDLSLVKTQEELAPGQAVVGASLGDDKS